MWRIVLPLALLFLGCAVFAYEHWRTVAGRSSNGPVQPSELELRALRTKMDELARAQKVRANLDSITFAWQQAPAPTGNEFPSTQADERPREVQKSPEEMAVAAEQLQEKAERFRAERRLRMDEQLQAEPRDTEWSTAARSTVEFWLTQPSLAGFSLKEMNCGMTLCRVKLGAGDGDPGPVQLNKLMSVITDKMGDFGTSSVSVSEEDGATTILGYLGRTGERLPD